MNAASGDRAQMAMRPCVGLEIPPGPAGLEALMPALVAAMDGTGPALGLLPGSGSVEYRSMMAAAVDPGVPVPAGVAVVAATSGSTGDPAGVLLPASSLRSAAQAFADRSGHPGGHRWVAALPLHHAGGLMVAVRSVVAGTTPVPVTSLGGAEPFSVPAFAAATAQAVERSGDDHRPLAVSLVPSMLALVDAAGAAGWDLLAEYDAVLVGGAAAPRALVDRLLFAGVHVFTSYGMTETSGGAVFDGQPLPGVSVDTDAQGRLRIAGAQVALGYRDGRQAQRWGVGPDGRRRFRTDDLGSVSPDGTVSVAGRVDDVVQVGGASVSLEAVARVLRGHPEVGAAEVVALPDARFGSRLVAVVVPRTDLGSKPTSTALADTVEGELGRAARPRIVRLVTRIPMLASGKPDRLALAELAGVPGRSSRGG
jgi:O-succinylbenzoic acid--CoA ligase